MKTWSRHSVSFISVLLRYAEGVSQPSPGSRVYERTLGCGNSIETNPEGVSQMRINKLWHPFRVHHS